MTIDFAAIRDRVDLVELVVSHGVELRKSGSQFVGSCPFHDERTPSFYVRPGRGFFCHGCGAKGDAIEFLMRIDGLGFAEAVEQLSGGESFVQQRPPRRTPAPTGDEAPARDAAALWARLAVHDDVAEGYLAGRGLLVRDPEVLRFSVGASGYPWLDARAREGYRVAFAVRDAPGNVQTISLRFSLPGDAPGEKKTLCLPGCRTRAAAIVSPGIGQLALGDPEFTTDRIIVLEGGTDFLGASALFAQTSLDFGSPNTWPLAAIGVHAAASVVEAFAAVIRWRTVLVGFDADEPGRDAAVEVEKAAERAGARIIFRLEPFNGAKDWAELAAREYAG